MFKSIHNRLKDFKEMFTKLHPNIEFIMNVNRVYYTYHNWYLDGAIVRFLENVNISEMSLG